MSVISLTKGQKIDLTKGNPNLTKIVVGLGWDTNKYSGGHDFDLDAAAFLLLQLGAIDINDVPLIFIRVRDVAQMIRMADALGDDLYVLTGFVFPKFTSKNGEEYFSALQSINAPLSFTVYGMPILARLFLCLLY